MKKEKVYIRNDNFPGPKAKKVIRWGERYYATTTVASQIVPARAKGVIVWDVDGNEFIDFVAGVGVALPGYGNPEIIDSMIDHLKKTGIINFIHHDFYNPWTVILAKRMARRMELYFEKHFGEKREFKMFFANSGAEIVEAALKLVWANRPERQNIIGFKGAFHGRTMGAFSLLTKEVHIKDYPQHLRAALVTHITYPKDEATFNEFKRELSALSLAEYGSLFMEIIQGEGGLHPLYPPAAEFIQKELVEKDGLYLVVDEVQTGNARTGKYLAFEHYPVLRPTIIVTAKGVASGAPFAGMWFPKEMDWKERGRHSSTYGGNALAVIAAGATLDYIQKHNLVRYTERMGHILRAELLKLEEEFPCVKNSRGFGLMQGFDLINVNVGTYVPLPFPGLRDEIEAEAPHWGLILMRCG
ncbi:MAG: aminotransferase class III-fold pyridoxal phosphate-dependent enzyme, partial [bacterium]|nr:aminotransferase class III-fold pyridoxal phosphate-dependent enzyme [bacterium]